jgi:hypothetical protein
VSRGRRSYFVALAASLLLAASGCGPASPRCLGGQSDCGGVCRTLSTDPANCGACGTACGASQVCLSGACQACPAGQAKCGTACARIQTDPLNCGACGHECGAGTGTACAGGACACAGGAVDCGPAQSPQCRTDTDANPLHCGPTCAPCTRSGELCSSGACQCSAGTSPCPGICADLAADRANCGSCGHGCGLNEICASGTCTACAGATPTRCGNACTSTQTDPAHCGSCATACGAGQGCAGGACFCLAGNLCDTVCVDFQTDAAHCGNCATACGAGQGCLAGLCTCTGGLATCGATRNLCCPAGSACACSGGTACQTRHSNGVPAIAGGPQYFFDCNPPGTWTLASAQAAAQAWSATGTPVAPSCASCFAWQTAASCATWCYAGSSYPGQMTINVAGLAPLCPPGPGPVSPWD